MTAEPARLLLRRGVSLAPPFDTLTGVWLKVVLGLAIGFVYAAKVRDGPSAIFFWDEDAPVLALCVALTAALGAWPLTAPAARLERLARPALWPAIMALACFVVGVLGARLIFSGYVLAQDEFLANFDAQVFAGGRLYAHVPPAWADYAGALQPIYMLPLPHTLWASGYLPVNAAMRGLASLVGAESLLNPALSAFSIIAVWGVARRLWPERPGTALVAAALLGTSPQLIITSMTAYAMPAHLAFNLAWLWLFLRGGRLGHAGALVVGFLAAGLHQLFFHPLFAAPFVLQLWLDRRWRLAALYTGAYALIGLFWLAWWPVTVRLAGVASVAGPGGQVGVWWIWRIASSLSLRIDNFVQMGEALVRFVSWQNPLAAPLAAAGAVAALRLGGTLRSLALGLIATVAVMLLLPSPTHGWGYRYLHGLLGSVALLAAGSWTGLADRLTAGQRSAAGAGLAVACAVSLLVFTPLRAWQAWAYVRPYAAADRAIARSNADVVVIDHLGRRFFDLGTLNRNEPFLDAGPKVMALAFLSADQIRGLCSTKKVELFDGDTARRFGIDLAPIAAPAEVLDRRALMAELGCNRPFVG
jgi:hypothetical protein